MFSTKATPPKNNKQTKRPPPKKTHDMCFCRRSQYFNLMAVITASIDKENGFMKNKIVPCIRV